MTLSAYDYHWMKLEKTRTVSLESSPSAVKGKSLMAAIKLEKYGRHYF